MAVLSESIGVGQREADATTGALYPAMTVGRNVASWYGMIDILNPCIFSFPAIKTAKQVFLRNWQTSTRKTYRVLLEPCVQITPTHNVKQPLSLNSLDSDGGVMQGTA